MIAEPNKGKKDFSFFPGKSSANETHNLANENPLDLKLSIPPMDSLFTTFPCPAPPPTSSSLFKTVLSTFAGDWCMHLGKGNGHPLQCSCLENPRDGGAWWAAVYGAAQSRTRLKRLSSSSRCMHPSCRPWIFILYWFQINSFLLEK